VTLVRKFEIVETGNKGIISENRLEGRELGNYKLTRVEIVETRSTHRGNAGSVWHKSDMRGSSKGNRLLSHRQYPPPLTSTPGGLMEMNSKWATRLTAQLNCLRNIDLQDMDIVQRIRMILIQWTLQLQNGRRRRRIWRWSI